MATTTADITTIARNYLRDFPKFFQLDFAPAGRTYNLGKPNVDAGSLWVAYIPTGGGPAATLVTVDQYDLDERNGLLRLNTVLDAEKIMVEGYYYEWLTPSDLEFYAEMATDMMMHNLHGVHLYNVAPAVAKVIGMYTLVQALWGLLTEYSRDIDVITSESVHIIASQRYRMVADLLAQWTSRYEKYAGALNIGIDRIEIMTLRRVSKTTGRYVPVYKAREVGDHGPIERIWPNIDEGFVDIEEPEDELRTDIYVDGDPPPGYLTTGYY